MDPNVAISTLPQCSIHGQTCIPLLASFPPIVLEQIPDTVSLYPRLYFFIRRFSNDFFNANKKIKIKA